MLRETGPVPIILNNIAVGFMLLGMEDKARETIQDAGADPGQAAALGLGTPEGNWIPKCIFRPDASRPARDAAPGLRGPYPHAPARTSRRRRSGDGGMKAVASDAGVNLIGLLSANLGLGLAARNTLSLLQVKGVPVSALDVDAGMGRSLHDTRFRDLCVASGDPVFPTASTSGT